MPADKSLYYYGKTYHQIIDSITRLHRETVIQQIPEGAAVLDAGCGTGELAFALRERKGCQVIGIDLSKRMVDFARGRNPYQDVNFLHRDASNIHDFKPDHFDYVVACMVLHELPTKTRFDVLTELNRVASRVLTLDYNTPLPRNIPGTVSRLIEGVLGRDHNYHFKQYLASGGLMALLAQFGASERILERLIFNKGCHQVIVVDSRESAPSN